MSAHHTHIQQTRPKTVKPTIRALLSLPFRICNPPPAVGKVRSCGVTPLIKVRLEDVLDRKHLPPLGLKDFEEWLLYVERCPENLYFTLWLKEYTTKYNQWTAAVKTQRQMAGHSEDRLPPPSSSHLAMFYARAKQTFFMPNSPYELNLPSNVLAPFHTSDLCQHPDPIVFHEVSQAINKMLERCLDRFVNAQLNNVGTNRVLCGIIVGIFVCLIGSIPPIVTNFTEGQSRWGRIAAFPGLWIGLTIFLAAINGICVGVYIFGDLRQLHKFELARPPISKPKALSKQPISLPITAPPPPPPDAFSTQMRPQLPNLTITPPPLAHIADGRLSRTTTVSSSSSSSCSSSSFSSQSSVVVSGPKIEISPAYFDTDPIDGPATSPVAPESNFIFPPRLDEDKDSKDCADSQSIFVNTASFIHPYDSSFDSDSDLDIPRFEPQDRQPISAFDFDALPPRSGYCRPLPSPSPDHSILEIKSHIPPLLNISIPTVLEQIQLRCNPKKWFVVDSRGVATEQSLPSPVTMASPRSSFGHGLGENDNPIPVRSHHQHPYDEKEEAFVKKHFRMVKAVPAFASLTRVLNPVIVRGQWEIVVKSSVIAFVLTWTVIGSLLAVPVTHQ